MKSFYLEDEGSEGQPVLPPPERGNQGPSHLLHSRGVQSSRKGGGPLLAPVLGVSAAPLGPSPQGPPPRPGSRRDALNRPLLPQSRPQRRLASGASGEPSPSSLREAGRSLRHKCRKSTCPTQRVACRRAVWGLMGLAGVASRLPVWGPIERPMRGVTHLLHHPGHAPLPEGCLGRPQRPQGTSQSLGGGGGG